VQVEEEFGAGGGVGGDDLGGAVGEDPQCPGAGLPVGEVGAQPPDGGVSLDAEVAVDDKHLVSDGGALPERPYPGGVQGRGVEERDEQVIQGPGHRDGARPVEEAVLGQPDEHLELPGQALGQRRRRWWWCRATVVTGALGGGGEAQRRGALA
jgi:hypothetical protein